MIYITLFKVSHNQYPIDVYMSSEKGITNIIYDNVDFIKEGLNFLAINGIL